MVEMWMKSQPVFTADVQTARIPEDVWIGFSYALESITAVHVYFVMIYPSRSMTSLLSIARSVFMTFIAEGSLAHRRYAPYSKRSIIVG
jgi:hypothetical protein